MITNLRLKNRKQDKTNTEIDTQYLNSCQPQCWLEKCRWIHRSKNLKRRIFPVIPAACTRK